MGEHGTRKADEANEYLRKEGIQRIRGIRDEVENLKEFLRLHERDVKIRPRVKLPTFKAA